VLLELEAFVTMSEMQAMEVPTVNANAATAAERKVKTALWRVVLVCAVMVTAVGKVGLMAVASAGAKVRRAPVLAATMLLDLMLDLVELALVATKVELNRMALRTVNAKVATAAALTLKTALWRVVVVCAVIVTAVGKAGLMAVASAGARVRRAPVLAATMLLDLMLDLAELALVATKVELNAMAPPTVNANVATAAALTVTTRLMRLLVKRSEIVAEMS